MEKYDIIIIGGGPAGLSSAIYSARFGLKTLIVVKEKGGLMVLTSSVENWPGETLISGFDLMQKIEKHATSYDLVDLKETEVVDVSKDGSDFIVKSKLGEYSSKVIVFATGTKRRTLNVPGESEFKNKGVSYCATCDGPMFKNKTVAVVGGNDSAAKEALMLTEHCEKVYIIYRGEKIRAEPINYDRLNEKEKEGKLTIINNTNIKEIKGDRLVNSVVLDKEFENSFELKLDGVFIEIGGEPQSEFADKLGINLNKKGEIIVNKNSKTNVEGIFAAGDVTDIEFKQAITGASQGVTASLSSYGYIKKFQKE